jgi:uncharacterized protein (TIGR00299 family) protein
MRIAFIDCSIAGVSGDMLTAALIDAGASPQKVRRAMLAAGGLFGEVRVSIKRTRVNEIKATGIEVDARDRGGRNYLEIIKRLKELPMNEKVRNKTFAAIEKLARAEAIVHGKRPERTVLHEVGAADAIADIVGCFTAANELGLFEGDVLASEVAVGKGIAKFEHGNLPLPAPAVLELLKGKPIRGVNFSHELTTPTGAALLVTLADRFVDAFPSMRVSAVGYGAGSSRFPFPNFVRVCLGESQAKGMTSDEVAVLETNLDRATGEVIGYTIERLLEEGALDASAIPILMKKGRPGFLIKVIAKPEDVERLSIVLMQETGTLGVRVLPLIHRNILKRKLARVGLTVGGINFRPHVKIACEGEKVINRSAEYDDAKAIAKRLGIPLREAIRLVEDAAKRGKS